MKTDIQRLRFICVSGLTGHADKESNGFRFSFNIRPSLEDLEELIKNKKQFKAE